MNEKYNLTLKERIDFVDGVVDLSKRDGRYDPALYDYAFRIATVAYFTDTNVNELNGEQLSDLAFSDETTKLMNEVPRKYILGTLNKACREKIEIERQQYMAVFEGAAKNQPFEQLMQLATEVLNGIGEQFDMNKMIEKIAEENAKKPVVNDGYRIKTPEGVLTGAPVVNFPTDTVKSTVKE
nr:MAG TPA: hypothetical protein [Caudoviricetes sp.]